MLANNFHLFASATKASNNFHMLPLLKQTPGVMHDVVKSLYFFHISFVIYGSIITGTRMH